MQYLNVEDVAMHGIAKHVAKSAAIEDARSLLLQRPAGRNRCRAHVCRCQLPLLLLLLLATTAPSVRHRLRLLGFLPSSSVPPYVREQRTVPSIGRWPDRSPAPSLGDGFPRTTDHGAQFSSLSSKLHPHFH